MKSKSLQDEHLEDYCVNFVFSEKIQMKQNLRTNDNTSEAGVFKKGGASTFYEARIDESSVDMNYTALF